MLSRRDMYGACLRSRVVASRYTARQEVIASVCAVRVVRPAVRRAFSASQPTTEQVCGRYAVLRRNWSRELSSAQLQHRVLVGAAEVGEEVREEKRQVKEEGGGAGAV